MLLETAGQAELYPRLAKFIRADLPKFASNRLIVEELARHAPAEYVLQAMNPESLPALLVTPMSKLWAAPLPNTLMVDTLLAEDFERQSDLVTDRNGELLHAAVMVITCSIPDAYPDNCRKRRAPGVQALETLHGVAALEQWRRWPGHVPLACSVTA